MFKPDTRREFLRHEDQSPTFEIDEMDFGFRVAAIRKIEPDKNYVRISHFVMPFIGCVPVGREVDGKLDGFKAVYQVPCDDHNTWRYDFFFKWAKPMTKEDSSKRDFVGPDYRKLRNMGNNYLQDRTVHKTVNFTGIEEFLNQDACATESMGRIVDRTQEHLGGERRMSFKFEDFYSRLCEIFKRVNRHRSCLRSGASRFFSHPLRCCVSVFQRSLENWLTLGLNRGRKLRGINFTRMSC